MICGHDFWHLPGRAGCRTLRGVDDRSFERLAAFAGLTAAVAVGLPVLFDSGAVEGPVPLWWISYVGFLVALSTDAWLVRTGPHWLSSRNLLAVQVGTAAATYLLSTRYGWTGVLLVITAAAGAYALSARGSAVLVVAQTALIGISQLAVYGPTGDTLLVTLAYGSFQAFAALMVHSERREAEARRELTVAHAELRAASALLAESSRTAERLRIARELHDLVGHQLTALSLELEVASHRVDGAARKHVIGARDTAKSLLDDVRVAVGELRLTNVGLETPLRALVDGLSRPTVALRVTEEATVDDELALAVVRCVQEVVTNTLRHANAQHLWINVIANRDGVRMEARDDGRGVADLRPGYGLTGMRERLEQFGGQLQLESAAGRGFRVTARVPAA
jgi:signal transduction histidine kinase